MLFFLISFLTLLQLLPILFDYIKKRTIMISYKINNNNNKNNKNKNIYKSTSFVPQPYCKVCHDAGLTEDIYTSHFIRKSKDPNSPVVCPTLLGQNCRYCLQLGHTVKYCPVLLNKNKIITQTQTPQTLTPQTHYPKKLNTKINTTQQTQTPSNIFNAFILYSDDEDEDEKQEYKQTETIKPKPQTKTLTKPQTKPQTKEEFPLLSISPIPQTNTNTNTHKQTYAQAIVAPLPKSSINTLTQQQQPIPRRYPLKYYSNWADAESSDEEEDI